MPQLVFWNETLTKNEFIISETRLHGHINCIYAGLIESKVLFGRNQYLILFSGGSLIK